MTFNELNMAEPILKAVREKGYDELTPIQQRAIPIVLRGADILGIAQTGTGKTAAFALPLLQRLIEERSLEREPSAVAEETVPLRRERSGRSHGKSGRRAIRSLVLTPTRELALQIGESFADYGKYTGLKHATIFGGVKQGPQTDRLRRGVDILIATPGRLLDLIAQGEVELGNLSHFVLDEADRMLDMGFFDDVTKIIERVKNRKNLGLFSATISQEVMTVSWMYQRDEVEITVPADVENRPDITQYSITCPPLEKVDMAIRLIRTLALERTIIFCNTKVMCQRLSDDLKRFGIQADCIHGDIPQQKREKTMRTFKEGKLPVLIATDVASRGIDVDDVDCVINYDVPEENEYYIHRIGRTGRAKKKGIAVSILGTFPEQAKLAEIAKYSHYQIQPVQFLEDGTLVEEAPKQKKPQPRRRFRR